MRSDALWSGVAFLMALSSTFDNPTMLHQSQQKSLTRDSLLAFTLVLSRRPISCNDHDPFGLVPCLCRLVIIVSAYSLDMRTFTPSKASRVTGRAHRHGPACGSG